MTKPDFGGEAKRLFGLFAEIPQGNADCDLALHRFLFPALTHNLADVPRYTTSLDDAFNLADLLFKECALLIADYKGQANWTQWNGEGIVRATKGWSSLSLNDAEMSCYRCYAHTPALAVCLSVILARFYEPFKPQ